MKFSRKENKSNFILILLHVDVNIQSKIFYTLTLIKLANKFHWILEF